MKRTIALILSLVMCLGLLAACKDKSAAGSDGGTTQTGGNLTVFVPKGWNLVVSSFDPNQVYVCKGGNDISKNAYVKLTYGGALPAQGTCENVQELEERTYGSFSWSGFSGTKPNGNAVYLVNQAQAGSFLATLWYTDESGAISLEDADVQAILSNVSFTGTTATTEPDTEPEEQPSAVPADIVGDWIGRVEFSDCTDAFAQYNGAAYDCIARFVAPEEGDIIAYIGVPQDCPPFTSLEPIPNIEGMSVTLSGAWNGIGFSEALVRLTNGTLDIFIALWDDNSYANIRLTLKAPVDTTFEAHANKMGLTDYPTAS